VVVKLHFGSKLFKGRKMLKYLISLLLVSSTLVSSTALGVELREIKVRTGTRGLIKVPFAIINSTAQPVSCVGELAHWYSKEVAEIGEDAATQFNLWFDPENGTLTLLNEHEENMPVERLWCGYSGRAFATRSQLNLERREGIYPEMVRVICRADGERLLCE
jgi:hypothetical protein